MTPEQVKALRAGDGVMGLHSGTRYIVRRYRADGWPIAQDKYGTEFCLIWMKIRRETFIEFLTRRNDMGETSWWAVALPNTGLALLALKYGDLWYWPAGTAVAYTALLVYMGWRNYTHKTV